MRRIVWPALALLAIAPACGDDSNSSDDGDPIDAPRVDARIIDAPTDSSTADAAVDASEEEPDAAIDASPMIDAAVDAAIDAAVDAMIDAPPAVTGHLLITEVKTVGSSEFIEIWNPTTATVDLRNYYLTDLNTYWQLPAHVAGNVTLTADASDFLSRFPVGATLAPNAVITIAFDGAAFVAPTTGFPTVTPTYTIQEMTTGATAMETVLFGATNPNPGLTNTGEIVVLFAWDGASDNVKDVDIVLAGTPTSAGNDVAAKSAVDGPDADSTTTAYATDLLTITDLTVTDGTAPSLKSYKRIARETDREIQTGTGNGITGDDETTEMTVLTWDQRAMGAEYTDATPGVIPTIP